MIASAARDLSIGGAGLAAEAFRAGLIDVCQMFVVPIVVGGGTRAFPGGVRFELILQEERRFANGTVYLHYRSSAGRAAERVDEADPARGAFGEA